MATAINAFRNASYDWKGLGRELRAAGKHFERGLNESKKALTDRVETGRHAIEDCIEDTRYQVKRKPMQSIGIAFAAGLCVGFAAAPWHWRRR